MKKYDGEFCLIWSCEHEVWWRARGMGYTHDWLEAGLYEKDEALEICKRANLHSIEIQERMVFLLPDKVDEWRKAQL